jgi:hypothetical protein
VYKFLSIAVAVVLLSALCFGQDKGRVDIFGGFSWLSGDPALINLSSSGPIGWNASATFPVHRLVGVVTDVSGYYPSCGNGCLSAKIHTFLVGPQFSFGQGRAHPFARFLIGDSYMNPSQITFTSNNAFTFGAGGGVDISLSRRLAWRGQVDWLHNGFQTTDNQRTEKHNVARLSTGIVIIF